MINAGNKLIKFIVVYRECSGREVEMENLILAVKIRSPLISSFDGNSAL